MKLQIEFSFHFRCREAHKLWVLKWKCFFHLKISKERERNPIWSHTHTHSGEDLCSWQHWNVMNSYFSFKNLFLSFDSTTSMMAMERRKGREQQQLKWFSILMLAVYIHHASTYIRNMCFVLCFSFPSLRTGSRLRSFIWRCCCWWSIFWCRLVSFFIFRSFSFSFNA